MNEVLNLKAFLDATGSRRKEYLPNRPSHLPARIAAVANIHAGSGKTTTCAHLAVAAAMDGYRVLALDLDSRAGLTRNLRTVQGEECQTVMPLIAHHYARHLRILNRLRVERGDAPVPVEESLTQASQIRLEDLVVSTRWPNLDLICADSSLSAADLRIAGWRLQARNWKFWEALAAGLELGGVSDRYDLILIDTPSDLGHLSLVGQIAARILLVPFGTTPGAFDAVGPFLALLGDALKSVEDTENIAARALGTAETAFGWDAVRAIITCYDSDQQTGLLGDIQASLGTALWPDRQVYTPLITPEKTVYDADYRDTNRETYIRARESFDLTYAAFKRLMIGSWRREELSGGARG